MTVVYIVCFAILAVAALMALARIERGPSMFDRVLGLDVITAVIIGTVTLIAAAAKRPDLVPVLIVLALVGFIGSVSIARFAAAESADAGRILTKEELEQELASRAERSDDAPAVHDVIDDDDDESGPVIVSVDADRDDEPQEREEDR